MKKLLFILTVIFANGFFSGLDARRYEVYDGTSFSILLTFDEGLSKFPSVSFSSDNKWYPFVVLDTMSIDEDILWGETLCIKVKDGENHFYQVFYDGTDKMSMFSCDKDGMVVNGTEWFFYRRKEKNGQNQ